MENKGWGQIKVAKPLVGPDEVKAVEEVLLSGQFVSGEKVARFEREFAAYCGCKYAVAVNSGTAALHIALQALGIGPGDEVIVPPLTFFATVTSVLYLGAKPVFADIDPDDLCLSPGDAERKITNRTKAILPVHLFGASAKMDKFEELSRRTGLPLVEDCAQAHGTEFNNRRVGSIGTVGCFSFFATKHMTTGEGGMITTNSEEIRDKALMIRNHGMTGRDDHLVLGFNNRMTEMEAAMGLVQLNKLDEFNRKRIANSEYILNRVRGLDWSRVPVPGPPVKHTYFWCPVMIDKSKTSKTVDELKSHLKAHKIGFRHRYQEPLYKQPVLKKLHLDYSEVKLPAVEDIAGQVLGLPNHPELTQSELERVVEVLQSF